MVARPTTKLLALCALCALASSPARAGTDPERVVPDYDGRGDEPTDAGDVLIWVPRIIFSPVYLVTEFVLRRPIGFLVTTIEQSNAVSWLVNTFTFDQGKAGIVPTFLFDFGLEAGGMPSAGLYLFWDEAFAKPHDIRLRAAVGGEDWVELDLTNRVHLGAEDLFRLGLQWHRRRDQTFAGLGPSFGEGAIGRYGLGRLAADLGFSHVLGARGSLDVGIDLRYYTFFRGGCCGDPVIQRRVDDGVYPLPEGYTSAHTLIGPRFAIALDSRVKRPPCENGVRAELGAVLGVDTAGRDANFLRVRGELGGYVDIFRRRVLGLRLFASATEPLGDGPIPFVELPKLGGTEPMRAFADGRLRDRSAIAAIVEYRWPIWVFLDGTLFAELGNVFGPAWDGLSMDLMRMSFGFGIRPANREDHPFELLFALGTDTIEDGLGVSTFRVVLGSTSGF